MRDASTYRATRRQTWKSEKRDLWRFLSWPQFNANLSGNGYGIACRVTGDIAAHVARSKYMPHIGKKQRAKGAA